DAGQPAPLPHQTQAVPKVRPRALGANERPGIAASLAEGRDAPELTTGRKMRVGGAAVHELLLAHREMKGELLVEVAFELPASTEPAEPEQQGVEDFAHTSLARFEDAVDGDAGAAPGIGRVAQPFPAERGQLVVLRAAVVCRDVP